MIVEDRDFAKNYGAESCGVFGDGGFFEVIQNIADAPNHPIFFHWNPSDPFFLHCNLSNHLETMQIHPSPSKGWVCMIPATFVRN